MLELAEKEAIGVYLLLEREGARLDGTMARLRKRIEDSLLCSLTVGELEDLEALYARLPEPAARQRYRGPDARRGGA